jgi:ABC-type multidrug transport system permease subunit
VSELVRSCRATPFDSAARALAESGVDLDEEAEVSGLQKANLVLVLLTTQFVQVLLLSLAVFAFFVVFGALAIDADIIASWTGAEAVYPRGIELVSQQLVQVSTFLAAFSGLYFTVYAVTDATYREQFFTAITRELEQAVNTRVVYRRLPRD